MHHSSFSILILIIANILLIVAYFTLPDEAASDDWYLANAKMVGLYRVNYEDDNWQRLLDQAATDPSVIIDYLAYLSIN